MPAIAILQSSLDSGIIPSDKKMANLTPVLKKGRLGGGREGGMECQEIASWFNICYGEMSTIYVERKQLERFEKLKITQVDFRRIGCM